MEIVPLKKLAKAAGAEILKYQQGEKLVIKTGRPWLDDVFPVLTGTVITIAAGSGVGKSTELQTVADNIMDTNINPNADRFVFLNISLEMKMLSLVLRGIAKETKKKKKDVLLNGFTPEEAEIARTYLKTLMDDRHYISQVPTTPKKFYEGCKEFLSAHTDKDAAFIAIDHLALLGPDKGEGKQQIVEETMEYINNLKMMFPNVVFILLSQLNGEMIKRVREKDQISQPRDTDLYYSGFTFQISDYVVVITNPYKMGLNEYSKVSMKRYPNLAKYFCSFDKKGRGSLKTMGVLYFHLLKVREAEAFFLDIYAQDINLPDPAAYTAFLEQEPDEDEDTPVFDSRGPSEAIQNAAGESFEAAPEYDNDDPF